MKISLKQNEIDNILSQHLNKNGISTDNKTITTTYTAGRKNSGLSVEIEITDDTGLVLDAKVTADGYIKSANETAETQEPQKIFG